MSNARSKYLEQLGYFNEVFKQKCCTSNSIYINFNVQQNVRPNLARSSRFWIRYYLCQLNRVSNNNDINEQLQSVLD